MWKAFALAAWIVCGILPDLCLAHEIEGTDDKSKLANQVEALSARVQQLERLLEDVQQQLSTAASAKDDAPVVAPPVRTQETASTGASVKFGGRIKADLVANSVSSGATGGSSRQDVAFFPSSIPLQDLGEDNQINSSARDSRLWFSARTGTGLGDMTAYLEMDFASSDGSGNEKVSNAYNPRLRHAYGRLGNFTVGQTSSTFLNTLAFPELNDANGPVGVTNVRQPLLRWQDGEQRWTLALEQPETTVTLADGTRIANDDDRVPDLIGRLDLSGEWGNLSIAAMLRQLRADGVPGINDGTATGAGLSAAGRLFTGDRHNVRFSLTWGRGIGRYVSYNAFDDSYVDTSGGLAPLTVAGGFVSYQHWWTQNVRTNWALGYVKRTQRVAAVANERMVSSHINLLWSPAPSATIGIEWLFGERRLDDGGSADLNRVQLTSLYKFNRR
jgi:hypothetical protein